MFHHFTVPPLSVEIAISLFVGWKATEMTPHVCPCITRAKCLNLPAFWAILMCPTRLSLTASVIASSSRSVPVEQYSRLDELHGPSTPVLTERELIRRSFPTFVLALCNCIFVPSRSRKCQVQITPFVSPDAIIPPSSLTASEKIGPLWLFRILSIIHSLKLHAGSSKRWWSLSI